MWFWPCVDKDMRTNLFSRSSIGGAGWWAQFLATNKPKMGTRLSSVGLPLGRELGSEADGLRLGRLGRCLSSTFPAHRPKTHFLWSWGLEGYRCHSQLTDPTRLNEAPEGIGAQVLPSPLHASHCMPPLKKLVETAWPGNQYQVVMHIISV